jgi:predicted PurR-regulated permease PerM
MIDKKWVAKIIILIFVSILILITFLMLKGIIISILLALILAYILYPAYKKTLKYVKEKNTAVILVLLVLLVVIAIPIIYLIPIIIQQTFDTYIEVQKINFADTLGKIFPNLLKPEILSLISSNINSLVTKSLSAVITQLTDFILDFTNFLLQLAVFLFTFYFSVRDAEKLREYAQKVSPFSAKTENKFLEEFRNITNAIVYGQFLIGLVQAIALGLGLFVLGVPKALILSIIGLFVCLIPILGAWLIWLPVSIYLIISGNTTEGIALFIYGALFISLIDNLLRTVFLTHKTHLSLPLSMIGIIGGLYYFGISGILIGPLVIAYLLIIVDFYKEGNLNELFKE